MRFIVTCMVVVGLCLLAMPLIPAFDGIQKERAEILANAATDAQLMVPPPVQEQQTEMPASVMASDADAAGLANIEPAAGDITATPDTFTGGFSGQAPQALSEPAPAPIAPDAAPTDSAQ